MTPTERKDRRLNIEGELKQARAVIAECVDDLTRKQEIVASAQIALDRAQDRLHALETECRQLADEARDDFLALIGAPGFAAPPVEVAPVDAMVEF